MSYNITLSIRTECGRIHLVACQFASELKAEEFESLSYDECREDLQRWLTRHYSDQVLADDGEEIENSGGIPEFPDDIVRL